MSPSPHRPPLAALPRYAMTIGGHAVVADEWLDVLDPSTEQPWAQVARAAMHDVNSAVAAAHTAFAEWSTWPVERRVLAIEQLLSDVEGQAEEFARVLHHERGGPLQAGRGEVRGAVAFARAMLTQYPPASPVESRADITHERCHRPWGVVAAITPWNFPLQLVLVKVVPALLCGNAVVVKPSPLTPVTALLLGEIARRHLPAGLVNVLTGGEELGPWITEHPGIGKISFTGSVATGRRVLEAATGTLKRVTLELGGNDAAIVMADADPLAAADALAWLAFANNGQVCLAVKRVYVHESIYEAFCDRAVLVANSFRVGPAADETVDKGPLQNAAQHARVCELIADAVARGGRVIAGGTVPVQPGYFLRPTVVADATDAMRLVREEQFGPVLPVLRFRDLDDAIRRANDSEFGLGSSVWSADLAAAQVVGRRLQAGVTWLNQHGFPDPRMPLAGAKHSGIGVEFGVEGVAEYTRLQIVSAATAPSAWFAAGEREPDANGAAAGQAFVAGLAREGRAAPETIAVIDPANEEIIVSCAATCLTGLDATVVRAHAASLLWRASGLDERWQRLQDVANELARHREELAWLLVREQGKPLFRARGELDLTVRFVRAIADQAQAALADQEIDLGGGRTARIAREALGVTAAIAPWNAPLALSFVKIATALAAGNAVVLKPSPNTPLATSRAVALVSRHLPPSVLEIVNGGAALGAALVTHPLVRKVSFTGSTATGKQILRATAARLTRLTLELGGNDAAIVLGNVDPAEVAAQIAAAAFGNSGQICAAVKRVYVARSIHDAFVEALLAAAQSFRVGPGLDASSDLGPVQNALQFARVTQLWVSADAHGGRSLCGGPRPGRGYFFDPAVVVGVAEGCPLVDEEQFGPVVPVMAFDSTAEAIARANATPYGLGASVWSRNVGLARSIAGDLEAGTVWINQHGRFDPAVPMPMIKESGLGIDYAEYGLRGQTQLHSYVRPQGTTG